MKGNKISLFLFVVGAVLLGLCTWGFLFWYGFGIPIAYPFGISVYPAAMPKVDPLNPPLLGFPPGLPFWGGIHLYLWSFIPHIAAMLMLIGGLITAKVQKEVS